MSVATRAICDETTNSGSRQHFPVIVLIALFTLPVGQ